MTLSTLLSRMCEKASRNRLLKASFGWETRHHLARPFVWLWRRLSAWGLKYLIARPVSLAQRLLGIELVFPGTYWRIGHFAFEIDQYLKSLVIEKRNVRPLFLLCRKNVANPYLLKLWEKRCRIIGLTPGLERRLLRIPVATRNYLFKYLLEPYAKPGILSFYEGPPMVEIPLEDRKAGEDGVRALGVPDGAWFACVHIRERGFLPELDYHQFRDCDPLNYIPAMEWIVQQGGYVIRMGDPTMTELVERRGIIDYAHSDSKSPFMDVYLSSQCRFFLGTTSGLFLVAYIFHRPVALADFIPFTDIISYPHTCYIPRTVFSNAENRCLTYREIQKKHVLYHAPQYEERGLTVRPNDPLEILDLTREAWAALVEGKEALDGDPWMRDFDRFLVDSGFPSNSPARIGRAFMRAHKELFS